MNYEKLRELFYNEVFEEQEPETGEDGRQHGLYVIQNTVNGKFYVGRHSRKQEDSYFGSGYALKRAVRKYGKENFQMKYFHWSENQEQLHLDESEVLEILLNEIFEGDWQELNKCSYNLKLNRGYNSYSEESRAKMSGSNNPMFGRTGELCPNFGNGHLRAGELNPNFGKTGELSHVFGRTGELHPNFLGIIIGGNKDNEFVVFNGKQCINSRTTRSGVLFSSGPIYKVIKGKLASHHGFKFHRTKDNEELKTLLSSSFYDTESKQVLEDYLSSSSSV